MRLAGIEYAGAPRAAARASTLAFPPRWIVLHDTGNNSSNRYDEANYARTRTDASSRWTSAHFYVDPGGVLGSLDLGLQAWAAYGEANANGVHIEMCRTAAGVHPDTVRHTASLVRSLLTLGAGAPVRLFPVDVALRRRGICGHRDITFGLGVGDHTDPGTDFDWPRLMALATVDGDAMDVARVLVRALQGFPDPMGTGVQGDQVSLPAWIQEFQANGRNSKASAERMEAALARIEGALTTPAVDLDALADKVVARLAALQFVARA